MISFEVAGAIFDVDDTLLDNKPGAPGQGLHERSQLIAVREIGIKHGIDLLANMSAEESQVSFQLAPEHTLESGIWNMLIRAGLAPTQALDFYERLLGEIVALKDELHGLILSAEGEEVVGATEFVRKLAAKHAIENRLAIASTATQRDVHLFLGKTGLGSLFPDERVITKDQITRPKPDPEVFDRAFKSLQLPERYRSAVCAFDDDPRGIESARKAGLYVCAIATRYEPDTLRALRVPPHLIARSYAEFSEMFNLSSAND